MILDTQTCVFNIILTKVCKFFTSGNRRIK